MAAHIAIRPSSSLDEDGAGCFVICAEHGVRTAFGSQHSAAGAACREHNRVLHA